MAYFIHKMQPKIFLIENVKGLLSARWTPKGQKGEIFEDVKNTFNKLEDYNIKFKLVYAKDYGVPQNRPRILLVGIRKDVIDPSSEDDDAVINGFLPEGDGDYPHLIEIFSDIEDKKFKYGEQTSTYPHDPKTDSSRCVCRHGRHVCWRWTRATLYDATRQERSPGEQRSSSHRCGVGKTNGI